MTQEPPLPVFVPHLGVDTVKALVDALDVGWLGMGASTRLFEEKIAAYLGLTGRRVVATNTGTSALHMALLVAGVGPGDEVITTSFNYIADHQAILAAGAEPVLCDIRDDNLGLDPAALEALIGPKTRAIIPLHFAGLPCSIEAIYAVARKHKLRVIEDATHAFGTRVAGQRIGFGGDITCFSFDPVKIMTSIDGGAVVLPSEADVPVAQQIRLLGVDKDTIERYKNQRAWEYDVVREGYRYHMTNINASVGLSQLARVEEFIATRQRSCRRYSEAFRKVPGVRVPETDYADVSPFIYFLRVEGGRRAGLIEALKRRNIATGIHFIATHGFTLARDWKRGPMTVTDRVVEEVLTLPLHSNMHDHQVDRVISAVTEHLTGEVAQAAREKPVKTVVISQPMYLPWRGMFEQIALSDVFVFYDDVQLPYGGGAGRGFTTRVQIKNATGWQWLSVPVVRGSQDQLINQTLFAPGTWRRKHLTALDTSYKKAPHYDEVRGALLGPIFAMETDRLSDFCVRSTRLVMEYLGLTPEVHLSSELGLLFGVDASSRVLGHCEHFGATRYVSGHGAKRYLRHDIFDAAGVEVCYMDYENRPYPQLYGEFLPYVSVIDLLVHTGREARRFLTSGARSWRELSDIPERPAEAALTH